MPHLRSKQKLEKRVVRNAILTFSYRDFETVYWLEGLEKIEQKIVEKLGFFPQWARYELGEVLVDNCGGGSFQRQTQ